MKILFTFILSLLFSCFLKAQFISIPDNNHLSLSTHFEKPHHKYLVLASMDTLKPHPANDTGSHNFYGNLINDDSQYNRRYPLWEPALEVMCTDLATMGMDRYILKADYAKTSLSTWGYNLRKEWEWDADGFTINFFGHPYSGSLTFNAGRSDGYNFYQCAGFSMEGSLLYEYFGENTRPSYNDLINTTMNGAFLGEILYRLSSNILDDRKTGGERAIREIGAGIIDPIRGINRLIQGKTFRVVPHEVYQKEPVNFTLYAGIHNSTDIGSKITGSSVGMVNLQIDYGNPFEPRDRKPFDIFRVRVDVDYGTHPVVDNIAGYGVLYGQNIQTGKLISLVGLYQFYDYWHNTFFEMANAAIGVGAITKLPLSSSVNLYTSLHFAGVPLSANAVDFGLDTFSFRKYHYGGGFEIKFETSLNFGSWGSVSMLAYYFWTHAYVGIPQNNTVGILRPRFTLQIFKQLSVGAEDYVYFTGQSYSGDKAPISLVRSEQKLFLIYFFEDKKRYEHYN